MNHPHLHLLMLLLTSKNWLGKAPSSNDNGDGGIAFDAMLLPSDDQQQEKKEKKEENKEGGERRERGGEGKRYYGKDPLWHK